MVARPQTGRASAAKIVFCVLAVGEGAPVSFIYFQL